jgi:hypothetical protein
MRKISWGFNFLGKGSQDYLKAFNIKKNNLKIA